MSILDILNAGKASLESEEALNSVPEIVEPTEVDDKLEQTPIIEEVTPAPEPTPLPVPEQVAAISSEVEVARANEAEAKELAEVERDLSEVDRISTAVESLIQLPAGVEALVDESPETAPIVVSAMESSILTIYRQLGMGETYSNEGYALEDAAADTESKTADRAKAFLSDVGAKIKAFLSYLSGLLRSLASRVAGLFGRNKEVAEKVEARAERLTKMVVEMGDAELSGKSVVISGLSSKDKMTFEDMNKGVKSLANLAGWMNNNLTANVLGLAKAPFRKEFAQSLATDQNKAIRSMISTPSIKEVLGSKWVGLGDDDLDVSKVFEALTGETEVAAATDKKQLEALVRRASTLAGDVAKQSGEIAGKVDSALDAFTKAGEAELEKAVKKLKDKTNADKEMQEAMEVIRSTTTVLRSALVGLAQVNSQVICKGIDKVNQYVYGSIKA